MNVSGAGLKGKLAARPGQHIIKPDWPAPAGVHALTTTRRSGVSEGTFASFNLATHVNDREQHVVKNRQYLQTQYKLPSEPVWLQQTHSNIVIQADLQPGNQVSVADASWTAKPGVVCAVLTADCLPVFFCDTKARRVAVAHAGWRGLHNGIISHTFKALDVAAENCLVWLGPAIGAAAFEVGEDVYQAFLERDPATSIAFKQQDASHWLCDVYQLARWELNALGVKSIYGGGLCTFSDAEQFYSFRRDGETGRMASLIWMDQPLG